MFTEKLLLVDGNSILNRAFYGIKLLTTKSGDFTNGIYGFLTMLKKITDDVQPTLVGIAFDMRAPTFRHKLYDGYKAQRKGMPPELAGQLQPLKEILTALGYTLIHCEGYEADDIIGTLAKASEGEKLPCVIATGDRDSLQLVSDYVSVRLAATKMGQPQVTVYDTEKIREDYGVSPLQLIDIKAIQGDSSDNIPGVAGIGPKGAGELVARFGSLDGVYRHIDDESIKAGMRQKLLADKDSAYLSYRLGTICTHAPVDTTLSHYTVSGADYPAAVGKMTGLELFSLIDKLGLTGTQPAQPQTQVPDPQPQTLQPCTEEQSLRLLSETNRVYVGASYTNACFDRLLIHTGTQIFELSVTKKVLDALCGINIKKSVTDTKAFIKAAAAGGADLPGADSILMDTSLAGYLLNPSATDYSLARLAAEYGAPAYTGDDALLCDTQMLPGVCEKLQTALAQNGQEKLLGQMEIPFAAVLAQMEQDGFCVDKDGIAAFGKELAVQLQDSEQEIYAQVGYTFNINSPKQLGDALFVKLGLPHGKKTKSGYSTNADVLEQLREAHPVVGEILNYRTLSKLKSTYCDGLVKVVGPDGRIHSSFNQTETRTGRISSTEPNLQNIPVRGELGRELRKFFTARPGWLLVDADYSQIELRVLAHVANDQNMISAFCEGRDIHTSTAARVFGLPLEMVTPVLRSRAKAVNFGIVYGIGAFSLAKDIGSTRKEAEQYIHDYLENFSGVRDYMERTVQAAKRDGYVETLFGRRRYLPELSSSNFNLRAFGERVARNMPIQGTAADIIKVAMIQVSARLKAEKLQARLILQVHDELIVECPPQEADAVKALLEQEMEHAVSLRVPLTAQAQTGYSWFDAHG